MLAAAKPNAPTARIGARRRRFARTVFTADASARAIDSWRRLFAMCAERAAISRTSRYRRSTSMTARKLTAFRKNAAPGPCAASTSPPMAGPTARAMLNATELSVTASAVSARGTSSGTSEFHAGDDSADPIPSAALDTSSTAGVVHPSHVVIASTNAATVWIDCATMRMRRRSKRSAITPAGSMRRNDGTVNAVVRHASRNAFFVSESISQLSPTSWMNVPTFENTAASQIARKAWWARGKRRRA